LVGWKANWRDLIGEVVLKSDRTDLASSADGDEDIIGSGREDGNERSCNKRETHLRRGRVESLDCMLVGRVETYSALGC